MTVLTPFPKFRAFDSNGNPLAGGLLYTYEAGTTTNKATYTDAGGGTSNANPVVLDSSGEAHVWLATDGAYKFVLKNSAGVTQWTVDNITGQQPIVTSSPADKDFLVYDAGDSRWENRTPAQALTNLGIVVSGAAAGDMLLYDAVDSRFENRTIAQVQTSLDIFTTAAEAAKAGGRLRNVQYYTTAGANTWTKPAWLKFAIVEAVGAGGGGGGASGASTLGKGGGAGGYSRKKIAAASLGATETATVGAKGTGGAVTPTSGGNGGNSTFGAHVTANGGTGGAAGAAASGQSSAGGAASGGDLNISGGIGGPALSNGANSLSGGGGNPPFGVGSGFPQAPSNGTKNASGFGAGGGGGYNNEVGGDGADGLIIVWEYE